MGNLTTNATTGQTGQNQQQQSQQNQAANQTTANSNAANQQTQQSVNVVNEFVLCFFKIKLLNFLQVSKMWNELAGNNFNQKTKSLTI